MTAPFAAREARVNQAVFKHLANAMASINGGAAVSVIFEDGYAESLGMAGSTPLIRAPSADVPGAAQGDSVVIGSDSYTVAGVEPDGTGVTTLLLQEV